MQTLLSAEQEGLVKDKTFHALGLLLQMQDEVLVRSLARGWIIVRASQTVEHLQTTAITNLTVSITATDNHQLPLLDPEVTEVTHLRPTLDTDRRTRLCEPFRLNHSLRNNTARLVQAGWSFSFLKLILIVLHRTMATLVDPVKEVVRCQCIMEMDQRGHQGLEVRALRHQTVEGN